MDNAFFQALWWEQEKNKRNLAIFILFALPICNDVFYNFGSFL